VKLLSQPLSLLLLLSQRFTQFSLPMCRVVPGFMDGWMQLRPCKDPVLGMLVDAGGCWWMLMLPDATSPLNTCCDLEQHMV